MKIGRALKSILPYTIVLLFFLSAPSFAADLHFQSETILRAFETDVRENGDDKGKTVVPLYEYLRFDLENLSEKNLSFHAFGWGRHDFSRLPRPVSVLACGRQVSISVCEGERMRARSFSKTGNPYPLPNLVDIQTASYEEFLQAKVSSKKRKDKGPGILMLMATTWSQVWLPSTIIRTVIRLARRTSLDILLALKI